MWPKTEEKYPVSQVAFWLKLQESFSEIEQKAFLENSGAEFWIDGGSVPIEGNSPSIGGWIASPTVTQHNEMNLTKHWDLRPNNELRLQVGPN